MSTYRSANTRQSQTQSQNQVYSTIQKRNPQFNVKQIPQLRPGQRPMQGQVQTQGQFQRRRGGTSVASTSVYDPDEGQPNIRLTFKQAITLITLRLGKLEVFMNETKITGFPKGDFEEGAKNVDKDFLLSIVARLDNMEKAQHNLRVEVENFKKSLSEIQGRNEDLVDQPVILDIFERLENLDIFAKSFQDIQENPENQENLENQENIETPDIHTEPETDIVEPVQENILVYNPSIIEPYQPLAEPLSEKTPEPVEVVQVVQPQVQNTQNPKTPRKKAGKKITI